MVSQYWETMEHGSFQFSKDKVLCEQHFEPEMFETDVRASLMGYKPAKKRMTHKAVSTIFSHCQARKKKPASIQRSEVRAKKKVIKDCLFLYPLI